MSSLGKGLASAALGALLQARGYTVRLRKLDPYLNVDPGTMSPYQHGEVFVTEDGAETDLDLGHYERFIDENLSRNSSHSAGAMATNTSDDALTVFAQFTGCYLEQAGMKVITIWDDSGEVFTGNAGSIYAQHMPSLFGVTHHVGPVVVEDGLAQSGMTPFYGASETELIDSINASTAGWDGSAPQFIAAQGRLWDINPTSLYNVMTTLQAQNSNYEFVRPDHFFELIREAAN